MSIPELIQQARRLARRQGPSSVTFVHLGASPYIMANAARYHYFRNSIADRAREHGAEVVELEPASLCLLAEGDALHQEVAQRLDGVAEAQRSGPPLSTILESFILPGEYLALRERLKALEVATAERVGPTEAKAVVETSAAKPEPEQPPEPLSGPLTPALLALIEDRLDGVDLEPFVRRQPVYASGAGWQLVYAEQIGDLDALAGAFFPAVEITPGEPLTFELQRHLDRLMLLALLLNRPWRRQQIGLDLRHAAWATDEYRRLIRRLDDTERQRLTIELDWLDALRDAASGGRLAAELRDAGFKIAIDRIGIDALPLVHLEHLKADWLKLVFDKNRLGALAEPVHLDALRRLDPDRLILMRTDDKRALELGQSLGIRHYQGPLVDRLAKARSLETAG
jgi:hypothetical protein